MTLTKRDTSSKHLLKNIHVVATKILEARIKPLIGEEALKELRKPVLAELDTDFAKAVARAEERWIEEHSDPELTDLVAEMPITDLPSVQQAIRHFYDNPNTTFLADSFQEQLRHITPSKIDPNRIITAVSTYLDILRQEFLNLDGIREKLNALAIFEIAQNSTQSRDDLAQLLQLLKQSLTHTLPSETLYDKLSGKNDGQLTFIQIVQLLQYHEARRLGTSEFPLSLDGVQELDQFRLLINSTVYHYQFCASPISNENRSIIAQSLQRFVGAEYETNTGRFVVITPGDLINVADNRTDDVTWFRQLKQTYPQLHIEHWGHTKLLSLFQQTRILAQYYYPELLTDGSIRRQTLHDTHGRYIENLRRRYQKINFIGMSVYTEEAASDVPMENIYIPLEVVADGSDDRNAAATRQDPLDLLAQGGRSVILGDPGSGKSTLLKFLALHGCAEALQKRYMTKADQRLPILVILRYYADALKKNINLSLLDYIQDSHQADFSLEYADLDFFEFYLETGQAILLFDGLDELPSPHLKEIVTQRIHSLITTYPNNTVLISSRIVGYDHPFRFDERTYAHYRLARLQELQMERFVADWYAIRIQDSQDRQANIDDLNQILRSPEHKAIRELAENPLLLTIITLVHRIDADLPDERVILYQKCTETLLNTWHTWKFRSQKRRRQGRLEKRNRRRIEAIAYWMHQITGIDTKERTVVSYQALHTFLTAHIANHEAVSKFDETADDVAADFLDFIQKRAGLLVEVGDQQYSFVHLTFQEYLSAAYLKTYGETHGVESIWQELQPSFHNPRWHEVIRLMIAAHDSDNAQDWFIEKLLSTPELENYVVQAMLLGGLILDNIESAEIRQAEILHHLLIAATRTSDETQLHQINAIINTWRDRTSFNDELLQIGFRSVWLKSPSDQQVALILVGLMLGWSITELIDLIGTLPNHLGHDRHLINLFFASEPQLGIFQSLESDITSFWQVQDYWAFNSTGSNFMAATGLSLLSVFSTGFIYKRMFELQLSLIAGLATSGPYFDFLMNLLHIAIFREGANECFGQNQGLDFEKIQALAQAQSYAIARNRTRARNLALTLGRDQTQDQIQTLAQDRAEEQVPDITQKSYLTLERSWATRPVHAPEGSSTLWDSILRNPKLQKSLLDAYRDTFDLFPENQWREALRMTFLPSISNRIILFDQQRWAKTLKSFATGKETEADIYSAAWQLLFDVYLYLIDYHDSLITSPFAGLADLTYSHQYPPLQTAHCIRDIAYGNQSRVSDWFELVQSDDPIYGRLFEQTYWRLTPEESIQAN